MLFTEIPKMNTPGTAGGPGGRDRTLAVKSRKNVRKITFFLKKIKFTQQKYFFCIYLLVMPKYWGNTPGTAGGPGSCDQAVKKNFVKK